jgi:hypothetical protein
MISLIEVLRRVNGQPQNVQILVGYEADTGILTIGTDIRKSRTTGAKRPATLETYAVEEYPSYDGTKKPEVPGRSFHLKKQSNGELYSVFISETGNAELDDIKNLCVCMGFMHTGICKHCDSVKYLVKNGLIADPKEYAESVFSEELGF